MNNAVFFKKGIYIYYVWRFCDLRRLFCLTLYFSLHLKLIVSSGLDVLVHFLSFLIITSLGPFVFLTVVVLERMNQSSWEN